MELGFGGLQSVVVPQAVSPCCDETCPPQVGKMTRGGRLGNLENLHQVPYAQLSIQKQMKNAQPRRIGERAKH